MPARKWPKYGEPCEADRYGGGPASLTSVPPPRTPKVPTRDPVTGKRIWPTYGTPRVPRAQSGCTPSAFIASASSKSSQDSSSSDEEDLVGQAAASLRKQRKLLSPLLGRRGEVSEGKAEAVQKAAAASSPTPEPQSSGESSHCSWNKTGSHSAESLVNVDRAAEALLKRKGVDSEIVVDKIMNEDVHEDAVDEVAMWNQLVESEEERLDRLDSLIEMGSRERTMKGQRENDETGDTVTSGFEDAKPVLAASPSSDGDHDVVENTVAGAWEVEAVIPQQNLDDEGPQLMNVTESLSSLTGNLIPEFSGCLDVDREDEMPGCGLENVDALPPVSLENVFIETVNVLEKMNPFRTEKNDLVSIDLTELAGAVESKSHSPSSGGKSEDAKIAVPAAEPSVEISTSAPESAHDATHHPGIEQSWTVMQDAVQTPSKDERSSITDCSGGRIREDESKIILPSSPTRALPTPPGVFGSAAQVKIVGKSPDGKQKNRLDSKTNQDDAVSAMFVVMWSMALLSVHILFVVAKYAFNCVVCIATMYLPPALRYAGRGLVAMIAIVSTAAFAGLAITSCMVGCAAQYLAPDTASEHFCGMLQPVFAIPNAAMSVVTHGIVAVILAGAFSETAQNMQPDPALLTAALICVLFDVWIALRFLMTPEECCSVTESISLHVLIAMGQIGLVYVSTVPTKAPLSAAMHVCACSLVAWALMMRCTWELLLSEGLSSTCAVITGYNLPQEVIILVALLGFAQLSFENPGVQILCVSVLSGTIFVLMLKQAVLSLE